MNKWDERFAAKDFYYGEEPNVFFSSFLNKHPKAGRLLLPGEGEGRNAVFAAGKGWEVDAFDTSYVAINKAKGYAETKKVSINYEYFDVNDFVAAPEKYDLIALIFFHLPENLRKQFHQQAVLSLKSGGYLLVESFAKEQIQNKSGGPPDVSMLYSTEIIATDFSLLKTVELFQERVILEEGRHSGIADLVRYVGQKV